MATLVANTPGAKTAEKDAPEEAPSPPPIRIRPDITLDHARIERRETARSLIVLAMFSLVGALCATVYFLMTK